MSAIQEYNQTEAELAKLRERMKDIVYEVQTTKGMEIARADRRELVTLRTTLEAKRKELKAPALKRCQEIDTEAKRITAELLKLEEPIDAVIKAEEQRKEAEKEAKRQAELQRIAEIDKKIQVIRNLPVTAVQKTVEELTATIERLSAYAIDDSFQEFKESAESVKTDVLKTLNEMLASKKAQEEELARLKAEQAERDRLAEIERQKIELERKAIEEERRLQEEENAKERAKIAAEREAQEKEANRIAEEQRKAQEAKAEAERIEREKADAEKLEADKKRAEKAGAKLQDPNDLIKSVYALLCHKGKTDAQKVEVSKVMLGAYLNKKEQGNE